MLLIHDYTVIAHAAYAKREEEFISFEDVIELSEIIKEKLDKNQMYFMFETTGTNPIEVYKHKFFREEDKTIRIEGELDDIFMSRVTMCYPEEVQDLLLEARREYVKRNCKVLKLENQEGKKVS